MSFSNDYLTNAISGTTTTSGILTIPSGSIVSFVPTVSTTGAREMIFGLIETIANSVSTGDMTNITVSKADTLIGTDTLRKTYLFTINLSYSASTIANLLDVKAE